MFETEVGRQIKIGGFVPRSPASALFSSVSCCFSWCISS